MDGVADGRWVAELSNWTGKAYKIPRSMLSQSKNRRDLQSTGIYLLLGRSDDIGGKDRIYIGEAENIYERLKQHASQKDFWFEVIAFISKDEHLNKAHIKYLESRLYELAQQAGRFVLENNTTPTRSKISEADQAEMEEFLQHIQMLTSILGHKVFENIRQNSSKKHNENTMFLSAKGIQASGKLTSEGFVVFQGSEASKKIATSFPKSAKRRKEKMLADGVFKDTGDKLVYQEDVLFASPSGASDVSLGNSTNGWVSWKNKQGKTLKEIED
jgi:hypothetical protein